MNLEGNKSTLTEYIPHEYIRDAEGMINKVPIVLEDKKYIRGILLPITEEVYIAAYGAQVTSMYKYLIKPDYDIQLGDYFMINELRYEVEARPIKWKKYQTVILKVI